MLKNYLLVAFRNLAKSKAFSFINIVGLAIGMAACLLILQYVSFELSFDNFHAKKDRIYRINQDRYNKGKLSTQWAGGAFAPGSAFKAVLPDIEDFVKIVNAGQALATYKDQKIVIKDDYYASSSFFNIFSFPLISGDPKTALKEPNTAVISEQVAQTLFHNINPVGQTLYINTDKPLKITGVMKNIPGNTHFKFDFLQSYSTLLKENPPNKDYNLDNAWLSDGCTTYLLLKPGVDPKVLEAKFVPIVKKVYDAYKDAGEGGVYTLQPVQSIHLYSNRMLEFQPNGDGKSVYLLLGIAIFVIIIAWINYINLATARGIGRAKEVGVRKTLGSAKAQLVTQFMLEAMLLNALAILVAVLLIVICIPVFASISGLQMGFSLFAKPAFWIAVLGIFLLGSFFSGFYPAIVLSAFRPVEVMKGKILASPRGVILRKGMVVFQFAASIFLLIGSLTVFRQLQYMQNQKLGIKIDQTLVIKAPLVKVDSFYRSMSTFKQECLTQPSVKSVTVSTNIPGEPVFWNAGGIKLTSADQSQGKQYRIIGTDYDYLTAYDMKLVAGRKFSKDFGDEPHSVVFNRKAVEQIGFNKPEEALGKRIDFWGQVYTIVGVVDNFHQQSLRDSYDALIFRCIPDVRGPVSIKISSANITQTIAGLKKTWAAFFPGDQFDYFFLDQHFNEQYKADQHFGQVFGVFTGIAIFVACLGLFGLVSYTIVQRNKEIGIRKVLGATVNSILGLLYKDFAVLVLVSFIVSAPLAWYAINKWLQTYAFRIDISLLLFIVPFFIVMVIAFATVSFLSVKAALTNPVKSLKTE
ncbi:ABC transporter permease [Mucilaginibacter pocheonensis]|uniref:ABC transport system permease protein n=1 Tax=Mucilaginibacter pocheonensis TaxID=398050 RepID=A0ABU1T615_9SPHI|nr:ABC transporter permease [Mucilaginibacter pocheonensis]MDR6940778.1 putative ABC transport system permease protein [Mucilaginibacter pocheonensis]